VIETARESRESGINFVDFGSVSDLASLDFFFVSCCLLMIDLSLRIVVGTTGAAHLLLD
jgi:hypothetical protein